VTNNVFEALVLDVTTNNNFKEQDSDCFLIIFGTLFTNKAAFVSTELANKACAHLFTTPTNVTNTVIKACTYLLMTPTNVTDPATKADLFMYSTTAKSRYTFIVFIGIMVNTSVSKKSIADYKQF
jgi:hypothetical protein